jgi:cobalamin biosynthesis Mg chelatase CobN
MRRAIFRGICVAGLLACIVTIVAPVAYGDEGLVGDVPEPPPVVTSTVTEVTQTAPSTESVVEQVNTTTAPVTETVTNVTNNTNVGQGDVPVVEATEVVQSVPSTSVATSTPDAPSSSVEAPSVSSSSDAPAATAAGSGGTTTGTDAGGTSAGGSSASGSTPATTGSAPSTRPAQTFPNTPSSFLPPAERGSLRSAPGVFFAQAGDSPEDILDELLDIGNSVGIDQVQGLQITNARGSNEAPESSGAPSTPAPLALTGIAIGAFLAIGFGLLVAGSGARAAGSTSAA